MPWLWVGAFALRMGEGVEPGRAGARLRGMFSLTPSASSRPSLRGVAGTRSDGAEARRLCAVRRARGARTILRAVVGASCPDEASPRHLRSGLEAPTTMETEPDSSASIHPACETRRFQDSTAREGPRTSRPQECACSEVGCGPEVRGPRECASTQTAPSGPSKPDWSADAPSAGLSAQRASRPRSALGRRLPVRRSSPAAAPVPDPVAGSRQPAPDSRTRGHRVDRAASW
jgi:hypothetical protein